VVRLQLDLFDERNGEVLMREGDQVTEMMNNPLTNKLMAEYLELAHREVCGQVWGGSQRHAKAA
jgi:hypothetical protein